MSTDAVAEHIFSLVKIRAKREGSRVKKLQDSGARDSVINGAAWRLILNSRKFGNIREFIEGDFWQKDSDERNKRIDRALDAERQAYKRASDHSGWKLLAPYAVAFTPVKPGPLGQPLPANSVTDVMERHEFEAEAVAADDARAKIEAAENENLRKARNAYGETLEIRHRRALFLICADPSASNSTIAAQVGMRSVRGIKPETVSKIRDKLTEIADAILTKSPEDLRREEQERVAEMEKAQAEVRRAESRLHRAQYWATKSAAELAEFRAFAAPLCEALNMSVDDLLGASIVPKVST